MRVSKNETKVNLNINRRSFNSKKYIKLFWFLILPVGIITSSNAHYTETCEIIRYKVTIEETGFVFHVEFEVCTEDIHAHVAQPIEIEEPEIDLEYESESERDERVLVEMMEFLKNRINSKMSEPGCPGNTSDSEGIACPYPTTAEYYEVLTGEHDVRNVREINCGGDIKLGCNLGSHIEIDVRKVYNSLDNYALMNDLLADLVLHEYLHHHADLAYPRNANSTEKNRIEQTVSSLVGVLFYELFPTDESGLAFVDCYIVWLPLPK